MAQEFQIGDVVKLKSGGPKMTIEGYKKIVAFNGPSTLDKTQVVASWFTNDKLTREIFRVVALELA